MTVRLYRSTDASAPVLTGQVGTLLTVLDAVLVNGYGSKTAAGWTKPYSGTNTAQYRMAAGGTGCDLYVNDNGPGAGGAREARINGFKTGSAIGAGTGQFPTTGQMAAPSGALVARKSTTADSTARAWTIIADDHTIYMFIETADQTAPMCSYPWMFGDFSSYAPSDANNCTIIGRTIENSAAFCPNNTLSTTGLYESFGHLCPMNTTGLSNVLGGHYASASWTGIGGSIAVGKHSDQAKMGLSSSPVPQMGYLGQWTSGANNSGSTWASEFAYPNGPDGGLFVAPVWLHHGGHVRGYYKGMWCPLQHMPLGHGDTYSASGNLSGKSMIAMNVLGASNLNTSPAITPVQVHIEYSDTWS